MVVLDPGHGGIDPGAMGPGGLKESDVVLRVAKSCQRHLELWGVKVFMTRSNDSYISLEGRAKYANQKRADAFLSIHCNSAKNPAQGIETFIARRTAVSYPLAEAIQEQLVGSFPGSPDRGVKRANFTVLTKTAMAAALAELEFIHTPKGERILSDEATQDLYGFVLATGLAEFLGMKSPEETKDPEEPVVCAACDEVEVATTPADFVEVGQRLKRLEREVFKKG